MRSALKLSSGATLVLVAATLAACSSSTTAGTPNSGKTEAGSTMSKPPGGYARDLKFTYVSAPEGDPDYGRVACGAKAEAERLGASLDHQEAQDFSASSEIPTVNSAATASPDALLVTPADPNGLIAPLRTIKARGIPIVTVINQLAKTSGINSEVTVDNAGAGRNAAKTLAKAAGGKRVKIASFGFTKDGSLASDGEIQGFEDQIAKYPNIDYVGAQYVGSDAASSTTTMNSLLAREPDLFGVFTAFGGASDGVLASMRQRNAQVKIVAGWAAASDTTVNGMRSGDVLAIEDFPFESVGAAVVDTAARIVKRDQVAGSYAYPSVTYTKASFHNPDQAKELGTHKCPA